MAFGFIVCFDSFLYTFTILPIRSTLAFGKLLWNLIRPSSSPLPPSQKADILRTLLLLASIVMLAPLTDASKIYHSIRGQDTIKLYVIFNALEVCGSSLYMRSYELLASTNTRTFQLDCRSLVWFHWTRYHRLSIFQIYFRGNIPQEKTNVRYPSTPILLLSRPGVCG